MAQMTKMAGSTSKETRVIDTIAAIRDAVQSERSAGRTIGLVPTMGALHAGHLRLVEASLHECDSTFVTIFVNPSQFTEGEDCSQYPRTLQADTDELARLGVQWVFAPAAGEIYPPGFSTHVDPPDEARRWEGVCRPTHFRGVATVVLKLFQIIPADVAFFGQKDYQQSVVVQRMAADFNLPIRIHICPTVRDKDGLAISSRNCYLSDEERCQAPSLFGCLNLAAEMFATGERSAAKVTAHMRQALADAGILRIEYVALVHPLTLEEVHLIDDTTIAIVAAYVGSTRLIDNRTMGR